MKYKPLYHSFVNWLVRTLLRPFSKVLPESLKFPVNGIITVKGNMIPPFRIATNPTSCFSKQLFWGNVEGFEYISVKIFNELIRTSHVFFDIGANTGYYSLMASSVRGRQISVYAFEPLPSAFAYLVDNVKINSFYNIRPQPFALSDQIGPGVFYMIVNDKYKNFPQLTGDGGLSHSHSGQRAKKTIAVQTTTLDYFVLTYLGNSTIDLIKLDAEANEHRILSGGGHVLRRHRPIIQCEILKNQIETEIEAILKDYDYLYYRVTDAGLYPVNSLLGNPTNFVDYYLVPKEKQSLIQRFVTHM